MYAPFVWTRRPLGRLWTEMARLQDGPEAPRTPRAPENAWIPALNARWTPEGAALEVELPGVRPEDLEITVSGRTVSIQGERKAAAAPGAEGAEGVRWLRREGAEGRFARTLEMPFALEAGAVEARLEDGLLRVALPRAEADKPRKISVAQG